MSVTILETYVFIVVHCKKKTDVSEGNTQYSLILIFKQSDLNKVRPLDLMASLQDRLEPVDAAKERSKEREVIIRETAKQRTAPSPLF